jgi:hypothetical protein
MTSTDGMADLESSGNRALEGFNEVGSEPRDRESAEQSRLLWVVGARDVPFADEAGPYGRSLAGGAIKHSNLTGGSDAYSGGEAWRIKGKGLLVNASSGRYGAECEKELNEVVDIFRHAGFSVASMGFDLDSPTTPNAVAVGELTWLRPL